MIIFNEFIIFVIFISSVFIVDALKCAILFISTTVVDISITKSNIPNNSEELFELYTGNDFIIMMLNLLVNNNLYHIKYFLYLL